VSGQGPEIDGITPLVERFVGVTARRSRPSATTTRAASTATRERASSLTARTPGH